MTPARFQGGLMPSFNQFLEDFFNNDLSDWRRSNFSSTNTTVPKVNVKEDDDNFMIEMAAPGMKKDDFKVELNNDLLTISSESRQENDQEEGKYTRREYAYHSFQRSFSLPTTADGEKVEAKYEDGVLKLTIPKKEEAKPKPPKTIDIS